MTKRGGKRVGDPPVADATASGPATHAEIPKASLDRRISAARAAVSSGGDPRGATDLPEISDDKYEIGAEVARGGLGRIISARDRTLGRTVALKKLALDHPFASARFAREVVITARLQHPSIIPLHEAGRWRDGSPFYSMKLVDGQSLAAAITATRSFADRIALLPHVVDIAEAMAYAHSQEIIHRDLKPANVLVGPFGETVVIDWGLAKDLADPDDDEMVLAVGDHPSSGFDTSDGAILGTPAYMPPEQAAGQAVDARADVYAIGALLYHILGGARPYQEVSPRLILRELGKHPPQPLEELAPELPRDLLAIVNKAMARDAEERYPSAREMAAELQRYTTGNLVGAHHYSSWELLRRFVARRRGIFITGTLALMVLVVVAIISFASIASQRDRAERNAATATRNAARAGAAQRAAEHRTDERTREHARSLLESDPTRAATMLSVLSEPVFGTATIAEDARSRGVASRLLRAHHGTVWAVEFSPAGDVLASAGGDSELVIWNLVDGTQRRFSDHSDRIQALAFAPDGRSLATASYDTTVRVWDLASGKSQVLTGHSGAVKDVVFLADKKLASIADDATIHLWDLASGDTDILAAPRQREPQLVAAPDGSFLATGSEAGALYLWNLGQPARPALVLPGRGRAITSLAFSPDSNLVAAGSDAGLRLFDIAKPKSRDLADARALLTLAFSRDGKLIAGGDRHGRVQLWQVGSGRVSVIGHHRERVSSVTFSPDGSKLVSTGWDRVARQWNVVGGEERTLRGHGGALTRARFSPDGTTLATASWDGAVRLWPVAAPQYRALRGHTIGVHAVAFAPDGKQLASGAHDHTIRLWEVKSGESRVLAGHRDIIYRVIFSPDGKLLASSSDDRTVRLWNVGNGELVRVFAGHKADVEELAFSADGRYLASAAKDDTVALWEVASGEVRILAGHSGDVTAVEFAGPTLASASRDHTVRLWTVGGDGVRVLTGHTDAVWDVAFSPDGTSLASVGNDSLRLWSSTTGAGRELATDLSGARHVAFSPDGRLIIVGGEVAWQCSVATATCTPLRAHQGAISAIAYARDGSFFATASTDNTLRLWSPTSGESSVLRGHGAAVFDVAVAPDGALVASSSGDANVYLWPRRLPLSQPELRAWLQTLQTHE